MIEKAKWRRKTEEGFNVVVYPETNFGQILGDVNGMTIDEVIHKITNNKKLVFGTHVVNVTTANQTRFEFTDPYLVKDSNLVLVFKNGEFMHMNEYTIDVVENVPAVVINEGINAGSVAVVVIRDTISPSAGEGTVDGNMLVPGSVGADRVDPISFKQWLIDNGIDVNTPVIPDPEPDVPTTPPTWADGYQPTGMRYGIKINKADSNPATRIEYILDAVGMTPAKMNYTTGKFDYGSWANVWFVKNNYPCAVRSSGRESYKLNPNDYSKQENGTVSDHNNTNYDGNMMSRIPLVYVYQYEDTTHEYIIVSDIKYDKNYEAFAHTAADGTIKESLYLSIYKCTNVNSKMRAISGTVITERTELSVKIPQAEANGDRWSNRSWSHRNLINNLLLIIGRSDNGQTTFGVGNDGALSAAVLVSGTLDTSGQFMGYSTNTKQVKVFHMESWWGDTWEGIGGLINNSGIIKAKMTPPYNLTGEGFDNTGVVIASTVSGYLKESLSSKYGRVPKLASGGSSATYQCDNVSISITKVATALVGGLWGGGIKSGPFCLSLSVPADDSGTLSNVSVGLSYI